MTVHGQSLLLRLLANVLVPGPIHLSGRDRIAKANATSGNQGRGPCAPALTWPAFRSEAPQPPPADQNCRMRAGCLREQGTVTRGVEVLEGLLPPQRISHGTLRKVEHPHPASCEPLDSVITGEEASEPRNRAAR